MQIKVFIRKEWEQVKPNVKYDFYKWSFFVVGGLIIALGAYVVHLFRGLPNWAPYAVAFVLSIVIFITLNRRLRKSQQEAPNSSSTQVATNALANTPKKFDAPAFFSRSYISQMQAETEQNMRTAAMENQPDNREGFYVKLLAVGLTAYLFDIAWAYIYGSQILLLMELNRQVLSIAQVKVYYDNAAKADPAIYANYSFDAWMNFMKSHILLIHHQSGMVEITVRGKDFLKYLTHWGRYPNERKF